jgi:hypothetical protein
MLSGGWPAEGFSFGVLGYCNWFEEKWQEANVYFALFFIFIRYVDQL